MTRILYPVTHDEVDALVPLWREAGLPPSTIAALELVKRATRISTQLEQVLKAELAELGLTYAEFDVLATLSRSAPPHRMRPSELTKTLFLTSGGTSNVLQRLTVSGYVEREPNPADARSRWVQLTAEGLDLARKALEASARAHDDTLAGVPEETLRHAADALRDVLAITGRRRIR